MRTILAAVALLCMTVSAGAQSPAHVIHETITGECPGGICVPSQLPQSTAPVVSMRSADCTCLDCRCAFEWSADCTCADCRCGDAVATSSAVVTNRVTYTASSIPLSRRPVIARRQVRRLNRGKFILVRSCCR